DADPVAGGPSGYLAVIDWGDGSSTTGKIQTGSGGGFEVWGTHSYASQGPRQVTVTVTDKDTSHDDAGSSATTVSTARVLVPVTDGSGYVYVLDADRTVYRSINGGGWQVARSNVRALVAGGGYVYELDGDHNVFR